MADDGRIVHPEIGDQDLVHIPESMARGLGGCEIVFAVALQVGTDGEPEEGTPVVFAIVPEAFPDPFAWGRMLRYSMSHVVASYTRKGWHPGAVKEHVLSGWDYEADNPGPVPPMDEESR